MLRVNSPLEPSFRKIDQWEFREAENADNLP